MMKSTLILLFALTTGSLFSAAERANAMPSDVDACRDCAFPLRVDHGRWLMPNGQLEVEINEEPFDENSVRVMVVLKDARSREFLASGSTIRPNFKNNFLIDLIDRGGKKVSGQIRWINKLEERIQAKFSCVNQCSIKDRLN